MERHGIKEQEIDSALLCGMVCQRTEFCVSFNYNEAQKKCEINDKTETDALVDLSQDVEFDYYEIFSG